MLQFDPEQVQRDSESLTRAQSIAFLLSVAERFYPYYLDFNRQHRWGEPHLLRQALDAGWSSLAGDAPEVDVRQLSDAVLRACPDTEVFEGLNAEMALAACSTAVYLLWYIQTEAADNLLQSAQAAADAVDGYVGWLLFPDYTGEDTRGMWQQRSKHPFMQGELRRQRDDIHLLREKGSIDHGVINELRSRWKLSN